MGPGTGRMRTNMTKNAVKCDRTNHSADEHMQEDVRSESSALEKGTE